MRFNTKTAGLSALAASAIALLLTAVPVQAQTSSPCGSETVVQAEQDVLRADCEALWDFYTQLDDPGVLDDAGDGQWGPNNPLSSWQGVAINPGSARVSSLALNGGSLIGPISSALSRLSGLSYLSLGSNKLTGPIPPELAQLSNLKHLSLWRNRLTGSIPTTLGQLTNLSHLALDNNQLSGSIPSELGGLAGLFHLDLGANDLTGPIPIELGRLSDLEVLLLWGNRLTGTIPSELGQLSKLQSLYLSGNELSGTIPSELGQLSSLQQLGLSGNELSGSIPSELGQLSNLRVLELYSNELSGSIPSELGQLSNLVWLLLNDNDLTGLVPSELGRILNLQSLYLRGNKLSGFISSELSRFDPYSKGPMNLIGDTERHRESTVSNEVWDVWLCDTPSGNFARDRDEIVGVLNQEITPYYRWLSNGRYQPRFRYVDRTEGPHLSGCVKAVRTEREAMSSDKRFVVIDGDDLDDYGGWGSAGKNGYVGIIGLHVPAIIHEIGHALGLPHSYGGLIHWESELSFGGRTHSMAGNIYEYDNPMDRMSSGAGDNIAMIAVHRYAAGWIDPANVAIHPQGKAYIYELQPPGTGGTQMLVLRDPRFGWMITLGARVAKGYDSDIPKEGVEAYKVDQFTRRIQPTPPAELFGVTGEILYGETKAGLTQHVHSVGEVFEVGTATVEVLERIGDKFKVRVVDSAEPVFAGRFSDDDGSAHESNIEAGGVTLGCSLTYPDRFCPGRVITRAQMMAFLARALGEEGNAAATTSSFTDVSGSAWYLRYVERLAELGVVEPYGDGTFRPSEPLTRSDMAVFLTRAFSHISAVPGLAGAFEDVPADAAYAAEVEAILAAGVTRGCSAEPMLYCPDESVTRAQMASFLARALEGTGLWP